MLLIGGGDAPRPPTPAVPDEQRPRLILHHRRWSSPHFDLDLEDEEGGGSEDGRHRHRRRQQQQEGEDEEDQRLQSQNQQPCAHHREVDLDSKMGGIGGSRWKSFSYFRLPEHPLRLTIVKLDGSSFDVQVMRSASVSELKLAVEEVFAQSPKEEGKISWSHVWGHFCLCYAGFKLIHDKTSLRTVGIKDGDKLHFIRHLSINYNRVKQRPQKSVDVYEQQRIELRGSEESEESEKDEIGLGDIKATYDDDNYFASQNYEDDECDKLTACSEFKLAHFLRGWLVYSGLCSRRMRARTGFHFSRLRSHCPKPGKR